jgi:hypothetical protein
MSPNQGRLNVTVAATGAVANATLAGVVRAAQSRLQSDLNKFQWFLVLQIGTVYQF